MFGNISLHVFLCCLPLAVSVFCVLFCAARVEVGVVLLSRYYVPHWYVCVYAVALPVRMCDKLTQQDAEIQYYICEAKISGIPRTLPLPHIYAVMFCQHKDRFMLTLMHLYSLTHQVISMTEDCPLHWRDISYCEFCKMVLTF
jgi:hypothetical protein